MKHNKFKLWSKEIERKRFAFFDLLGMLGF